jgi:hypothetical protein
VDEQVGPYALYGENILKSVSPHLSVTTCRATEFTLADNARYTERTILVDAVIPNRRSHVAEANNRPSRRGQLSRAGRLQVRRPRSFHQGHHCSRLWI